MAEGLMTLNRADDSMAGGESHIERVCSAVDTAPPAAGVDAVASSWRRCLSEHHVDPVSRDAPRILSSPELREIRDPVEDLVATAREETDRLHAIIGKIGYAVLLTSTDGVVVDFRGDNSRTSELQHWGIWDGAVWSEDVEGTNGIGTCIAEERPVTIHRTQHFRERHTSLSCCGAPVFGPDGKLAAVLDVTSIDPEVSERSHALALVIAMDAARAIEERMFRQRFGRAWGIFVYVPLGDGHTVNLAVDADFRIVGAGRYARLALGLDDEILATGISLWSLFERAPLKLHRTREVITAQLTRSGHHEPWAALIVPPDTGIRDARHALLRNRPTVRGSTPASMVSAAVGLAGAERTSPAGAAAAFSPTLSPRESAILELIGEGRSNKQIAQELHIAPETVKTHVKHLFAKLDVERRAQAVSKAQSLGFASLR
jgi:transcriptional regulator of acetoin/glycerol metabolism/DNA-binding CsgD family transcriptional regulator